MQVFDDLRNYVKAGREVSDKNHHREFVPVGHDAKNYKRNEDDQFK